MKKLIIETSSGKTYFEIEEYGGKFTIQKIVQFNTWTKNKKEKIGQAKNIDDAISIAKTTISGTIKNIELN